MLDKQFDPKSTELHARQAWQEVNFKPSGHGESYCIMLPPPNVTGTLHMGHGFQHTLMDALIRYHRMCGFNTLWQPGTDHAGIATQMVVERQLEKEGTNRKALGREAFEERVWQWKEQSGGTIVSQMKKLGASADWSRSRFTMDEGLSQAVLTAFIKLYDDGLIYRGTRLVNWDPVLHTALSDLEVLSQEEDGSMYHLRYPLVEPTKEFTHLVVATTRPETMFGDVAVAVNPEDERYKNLIGKKILLPLSLREIPIIADDYVDKEFGTGCVKITPAHDFNDYEMGKRHALESINIFTQDAQLNQNVPAEFQGLAREAARKQVIETLTAQDLIEKIEPHKLSVPRSERSNAIVEPYMTEQWYVKMDALAKPALEVVENGTIEFIPENWRNTYRQWLTNIQDWCISRQLWWGHRIPAWYDEAGNIYVAQDEDAARSKYNLAADIKLRQDDDVLDTWFSSALWPFSTLGWPEKTPELETFYPTSVLVTGFDIIFFWVARMIMFGLYLTGQIPFKQVLYTGLIRDHDGQKMSKSKGNVIDPIDLIDGIDIETLVAKRTSGLMMASQAQKIEKATRKQFPNGIPAFGEDAVRFTYCALATHGRDIRFDLARVEGYRNFCNKLWNAARFITMQLEQQNISQVKALSDFNQKDFSIAELWILSSLERLIQSAHQNFNDYRFDLLAHSLYEFTWNEYCDWFLEFAKVLNRDTTAAPRVIAVTIHVMQTILKLLHPLMPFITEDLWAHFATMTQADGKALMLQQYPKFNAANIHEAAEQQIQLLKNLIASIRQIRSEFRISPAQPLPHLYWRKVGQLNQTIELDNFAIEALRFLAKVEQVAAAPENMQANNEVAANMVGELEILIPLAGLVDFAAERERIQKEIQKVQAELQKIAVKFDNPNYIARAPQEIIEKERARIAELELMIQQLTSRL